MLSLPYNTIPNFDKLTTKTVRIQEMNIKKLVIEFGTVFAVALAITALVTLLWSLIVHGAGAIDWDNSFRFAILFGIIVTWVRSREVKEK
jgi:hypothetical protein